MPRTRKLKVKVDGLRIVATWTPPTQRGQSGRVTGLPGLTGFNADSPDDARDGIRALFTTETSDKQCGSCGWMLSEHWTGGVCPDPARELCGSCEAGLPMSCICVDAPTETGECPECGASADGWCRDGCRPVDPMGYR